MYIRMVCTNDAYGSRCKYCTQQTSDIFERKCFAIPPRTHLVLKNYAKYKTKFIFLEYVSLQGDSIVGW